MKKFPNAFIIMLGAIFLAWMLTFIIPQGSFERVTDPATGISRVVNDTYHQIEGDPVSVMDFLLSIPNGLIGRADLIVLILLIGGCFYVIEKTGALAQGLGKIVSLVSGREGIALIAVTAMFTTAGATIGMQEEVIGMMPVLILFSRALGYNTFVAIGVSYGATVLGSAFSPMNPFAVLIAQKEAELPLLSGSGFRLVVLVIAFIVYSAYLLRYARKNRVEKIALDTDHHKMDSGSFLILSLLVATFGLVTFGLLQWDWSFNELSACFFLLGLVAGLLGKMGINKTGETYIEGFREMIFAGVIIGLAYSITLLLKEGMVIDSIIQGLFGPLGNLPSGLTGVSMLLAHAVLHLPVPSYSGQAIMTMPILVPLSDLVGLSRQVCVLAYQYGAVLMDMVVPTNGALMAVIALGGVSYDKWLAFVWKPILILFGIGIVAILVGAYTGF
ncbi:YfcC family protein [Robiginitalea sp. IMCC43444]|uniref:YfcC family protein n=1 Tax=Robiginitalea sp. IMCC43444 TaxID=3459121 RepID=UPI00404239E1